MDQAVISSKEPKPGEYIERTGGLIRQDQLRLRQERTHDAHAHHRCDRLYGRAHVSGDV